MSARQLKSPYNFYSAYILIDNIIACGDKNRFSDKILWWIYTLTPHSEYECPVSAFWSLGIAAVATTFEHYQLSRGIIKIATIQSCSLSSSVGKWVRENAGLSMDAKILLVLLFTLGLVLADDSELPSIPTTFSCSLFQPNQTLNLEIVSQENKPELYTL